MRWANPADESRKPKPKPDACLYHANPLSFRVIMADLSKSLRIPAPHSKRAAMTVCSCRSGRASSQRTSVAELQVLLASSRTTDAMVLSRLMEDPEKTKGESASLMTIRFVENAFRDARIQGTESAVRFSALLKMAFNSDFSLLKQEASIGGGKCLEEKDNSDKSKQKRTHFSAKSHSALMFKRKRQIGRPAYTIILPMFGGNSNLLQEKEEVGRNFKNIALKFKPCVIEIDYEATGIAMAKNQQKTMAKVWCKQEHYQSIWIQLVHAAEKLQNTLTAIHVQKLKYAKGRRQAMGWQTRSLQLHTLNSPLAHLADPELAKEIKSDDFSKKQNGARHDKMKTRQKTKQGVTRCLHCQNTPDDFDSDESPVGQSESNQIRQCGCEGDKARKNIRRPTPLCRYHPGFIERSGKWSCCLQDAGSSKSAQPDSGTIHKTTGCVNDQPHVWRYKMDRPSNKEHKKKVITTPNDSFVFGKCRKPLPKGHGHLVKLWGH